MAQRKPEYPTITAPQRRMLHAARRQLGLDDAAYRELLYRCAGARSSTELGPIGFEALMRELKRAGFRNTSPKKRLGLRPGMASDAQLALLRRLAAEYFDQAGDAPLCTWLERSFGVSAPRFLTAETAQKAITGLKKMTARRSPPAA